MVELGRRFLLEGPYKDIIEDHPEIPTGLAEKLLALQNAKVLVVEETGRVEGMMAFIVYPHFYSGVSTAQELIWYCTVEARKSFAPICLMRAAQRMAKEMGAKYMQFTAPTTEVGKLYEMSGYTMIEVGYQKEL